MAIVGGGPIYCMDILISSNYTYSGGYLGKPKALLFDDELRGLVVECRRGGGPGLWSFTLCTEGRKIFLAVSAPDFILFQSVVVTKQKSERYLSLSLSPSNTGRPG